MLQELECRRCVKEQMGKQEKEIQESFERIMKTFDRMDASMTRITWALYGIYAGLTVMIIGGVLMHVN